MLECLLSKRQQIINVDKDVERREHLYTVGRNVKWYNYFLKIPQTIKIELFFDPAIPLLSKYPKGMKLVSQRNIYTPMFMPALFTIV